MGDSSEVDDRAGNRHSALLGRFSNDVFEFMFARWFLAPELFHFYREMVFFRWVTEIGDFFNFVSRLQERCCSATFWANCNHVLVLLLM
jgi:hypothetical protein